MLAQNFKTAADLDITDAEFGALRSVLGMFERGEVAPENFDMRHWDCGTVHCIGGWARIVLGDARGFKGMDGRRDELFYPRCYRVRGNYVSGYTTTLPQATIALRNYLTHGEPRWAEALSA